MAIRFGEYCLDLSTRQLFGPDGETHLPPKAFAVLAILLERRPAAIAKDELVRHVWPDTFVSDVNLARLITELRSTLGDQSRHPRFIRTVHAFGYAFSADATEVGASDQTRPAGWLVTTRADFPLVHGENVIGRDASVAVRLHSPSVSRFHARLVIDDRGAHIEDLGSRNSTLVGDSPLESPRALQTGERIQIGSFLLTFRFATRTGATETAAL
jgi:DNA-binding winged helix-turn-helix (wHTH) protein